MITKIKSKSVRILKSPRFGRVYLIVACTVLGMTTLLWATLGALTHLGNADQLVNTYLVENPDTFFHATFPDQHSFLLKLPFFLLIHAMGSRSIDYSLVTILVVLLTVGLFAFLLSRIERRPVVLGTFLLAMALCLLLIPAQPYAGAELPVNMAMVTTRNLEYIVFIASLYFVTRIQRFRSPAYIAAIVLLTFLFASDKLFVPLALGGSILLLVTSLVVRRRDLIRVGIHWLITTVASIAASVGLLLLLNFTHLLHTTNALNTGPYGLVGNVKDIGIGIFYAITSIFTNFGANPLYDVRVIKDIPAAVVSHLATPSTISFLMSLAVTILIIFVMGRIALSSLRAQPKGKAGKVTKSFTLSLMLFWISVTAIGAYILSHHYYPVDARYEAIIFFAGFVCLTQYFRHRKLPRRLITILGVILLAGIILAIPFVVSSFNVSQRADDDLKQRNSLITKNLAIHPVDTLVGDYWRVVPIKLQSNNTQAILPLDSCKTPRDILSSSSWQLDLSRHSFAYIVTLDASITDFPACSLDDVVGTYGRPNQTAVIKGSVSDPKELLLFYDHGSVPPPATSHQESSQLDTILPVALGSLPNPTCEKPTIMNFVAHQDDDILFMNPDLIHDIDAGHCIRTVYFTAGDAGGSQLYWLSRQKGAEAAYNSMLGKPDQVWTERTVILSTGQFATVANPKGNRSISLIFLHLPDGNLKGNGFAASNYESLTKLKRGTITSMKTVDHQSSYTSNQLSDTLATLIQLYKPDVLRSQGSYNGGQYADHADHLAISFFTDTAREIYKKVNLVDLPITYYTGYPVHSLPANVSGIDLARKSAAFFAFGEFDDAVCRSMQQCDAQTVYGIYLRRQYTSVN